MKIYTYSNPFTITKEAFWDDIKAYPHFCVSQTLVQGLTRHYGRNAFTFICTIDKIINSLFSNWYQNPETSIAQYVSFSKFIDNMTDEKLKRSFKFNKRELVDAARFLFMLGVNKNDFSSTALTAEQKAFLDILDAVKYEEYWRYSISESVVKTELQKALVDTLQAEVKEYLLFIKDELSIKSSDESDISDDLYNCMQILSTKLDEASKNNLKRLEHYMALIMNPKVDQIKTIVLHGVHQFTPKILSAIRAIENAGIEIIFLFNYQSKYRHVYETWEKVYAWAGHKFTDVKDSSDFDCRLLGECIGNVLEGRRSGDVRLDASILKYANKTEFSDIVADVYSDAEAKTKNITDILSAMDEQYYGVQSEPINEILKFYFPRQFGERHFLAYPIGQFILSLYNMWNEKQGLVINEALLKECFSVNIWSFHGTSTPIGIYEKLKTYISDLDNLDDILKRLKGLIQDISSLDIKNSNPIWAKFPFFNCPVEDVEYFINVLTDLQKISDELFAKNAGSNINFRKHFEQLIKIISMRMKDNRYITDQERQLVTEVQERLSSLKGSRSIDGSIDDLKETLHYYLKNENDDDSANWIVRNFEQIDGGVLLSPYTKAKIYHYALLSDKNMKKSNDDFFPWPLNEKMFECTSGTNEDISIILNSYREYCNFLRYCVFYGTYFLDGKKKIQFSFIEDNGLDKDIPYYILTLLGLNTVTPRADLTSGRNKKQPTATKSNSAKTQKNIDELTEEEHETFGACKYRFLLSRIIDKSMYFTEAFDCKRLYSLLLFSETWQRNIGIPMADIYTKMIDVSAELKAYFPFFKTVDFIDMESTAYNYLTFGQMIKNGVLQEYHSRYVRRKVEFKDSRKNISQRVKYSPAELINYLSDIDSREPLTPPELDSTLCKSCNQRSICMRAYVQEV